MEFSDLENRGAWQLLMDARAHILAEGTVSEADEILSRAAIAVYKEIKPNPKSEFWIQHRVWREKKPANRDMASGVEFVRGGKTTMVLDYTENG